MRTHTRARARVAGSVPADADNERYPMQTGNSCKLTSVATSPERHTRCVQYAQTPQMTSYLLQLTGQVP